MSIALEESKEQAAPKMRPRLRGLWGAAGAWLDERTGFLDPIYRFLTYPVPKYVHKNLLYSLGGLTLIALMLQLASGLLLSFYYDPSPAEAYNSVDYVTYQLPLGWLVRGVHFYNASAIVILVALHLLRTFFFSAYKKPREITWLSGVLLLLVTLGFAFTGYLLPWDQRGYWATKVGTEIAGSAPFMGQWLLRLVRGGPELGQATLTRFYVIHMLLPGALLALIALHLHQLRYHGMSPPITKRAQAMAHKFVPFFPHWVVVDAALGIILLGLLIYLSWNWRAPLEFPADPTSTDFLPRPEWYFLFLFQLLKYFPGPLEPIATMLIPALVIGSLVALPFLDRGEERRPWRKPIPTAVAIIYVGGIVALTLLAMKADQESATVAAAKPAVEAVVKAEPETEVEVELEPETESAAVAEARPDVEAEVIPETKPTSVAKAELEVEAEPEPEMEPAAIIEVEPAIIPAEPEIVLENEPEAEPTVAAEVEVEAEEEAESEAEEAVELESERAVEEEQPAVPAVSPAALAPLSDQANTLIAIPIDEARPDSYAEFWAKAPRLEVTTTGAKDALNDSGVAQGALVTIQAAYDSQSLLVRAEWADSTESILKSAWHWDGSRFIKMGNEDRFILLWPIGNNPEFSNKGCAAACHQADEDDDWWMGSADDNIRYDVWQWQSARTNPVAQAGDEWWSTLTDPGNPDSSRHSDTMESGGYQENMAEDKRGPAFMHGADLANPFIFIGQEAPVDPTVLNAGAIVPGYLLAPFAGSRGDVSAQGQWVDGKWIVVLQRVLDTGHNEDTVFTPGKRLPFGLAVMDQKNGIDHTVAPEVLILAWQ